MKAASATATESATPAKPVSSASSSMRERTPDVRTRTSATPNGLQRATYDSIVEKSAGADVQDDDVVYCDGACKGNGKEGSVAGLGVWWGYGDPRCVC